MQVRIAESLDSMDLNKYKQELIVYAVVCMSVSNKEVVLVKGGSRQSCLNVLFSDLS